MHPQNSLKEGERDLRIHARFGTQMQAKAVTKTNSQTDQAIHSG